MTPDITTTHILSPTSEASLLPRPRLTESRKAEGQDLQEDRVTWNAYPGAKEYVLEFMVGSPSASSGWEEIARVANAPLEYVHQRPPASEVRIVSCRYKVLTQDGQTLYSDPNVLVWSGGPLEAQKIPSDLRATRLTGNSVELAWDEYPGAIEYGLEVAAGPRSDWQWEEIARVQAPTLSFVHESVEVNEDEVVYRYWAVTDSGTTPSSAPTLLDLSQERSAAKEEPANEPVLPTIKPTEPEGDSPLPGPGALLSGELVVVDPCLYLVSERGTRVLPVFYEGTVSWERDALVLYGQRFEIGERLWVGGGETATPGNLSFLQAPHHSCDIRNVWIHITTVDREPPRRSSP